MKKFSDTRLEGYCTYCGKKPETSDHIPSKILMDRPFPENLPVVPACEKCNLNFSKDEEYFACLIECVLRGDTEPDKLERKKVKDILKRKPKLRTKLAEAMEVRDGHIFFRIEEERIKNVIIKLARGHATYENSELQLEEPVSIRIRAITMMNEVEQKEYFSHYKGILPEVGSRAFQRLFMDDDTVVNNWIVVQEGKYMYSVNHGEYGLTIKFLIWNYLACEVVWN